MVFKKRQNIYYVKLQEKLSTLNADEDYTLVMKTVRERENKSLTFSAQKENLPSEFQVSPSKEESVSEVE